MAVLRGNDCRVAFAGLFLDLGFVFALAFVGMQVGQTIAMWWVYFHIGHKRGIHQIEHLVNPGQLARLVFTYFHVPIVAGIVISAVARERAIVHPGDAGVLAESASAIGGLRLFLLGNGLVKRVSAGDFPLSHWVGLGLCGVAVAAGPWTTLLGLNLGALGILVVVPVWENRSFASGMPAEA